MNNIQEYNKAGTTLRVHQLKMLDMLTYIDELCKKHNITYYLSGGTLLGAVRHKGFIPWDDDLDIVLMKKDFKKLHRILMELDDDQYVLHSNRTDENYVAPYCKLRMKNTLVEESNNADRNYKYRGIYIDIFYLEPAHKHFHRLSDILQTRLIKLMQSRGGATKRIPRGLVLYHKLLANILFPCFSWLSSIINPGKVSYPLGSFFNTQFEKRWIFPPSMIEFEDKRFSAPFNCDKMLEAQYGDYMKIPALDSIVFHITHVEFND